MSELYSTLAPYYDRLMVGIDYEKRCEDMIGYCEKAGIKMPCRLLDMGCGSGEMAIRFAKRGFEVTALDISEDMLALAESKARAEGVKLTFVKQDMSSMVLPHEYDMIICCTDCLNYITEPKKLVSCFRSAKKYLAQGGLFFFDATTQYKFENIFACRDYILEDEGVLLAWQNEYDPESQRCEFILSIFAREEDGSYRRLDEIQHQRCYTLRELKEALLKSGLLLCEITADNVRSKVGEKSERWNFVVR